MTNAKKQIENIIGTQRVFKYTDIKAIAKSLNETVSDGEWEVGVQHLAYKGSTHASLFLNVSDVHPCYRFIATRTGTVKDDAATFKLKDFAPDTGVEKTVVWE